MVDSYSKWLDVEIVSHCDTKSTTLFLSKWFSQYGIPVQLISDNGTQFTSQEFKNFIKTLGIKHIRTAAYHQSSNGQAKRYVQTVKNGLESNYCNNKTFKGRLFDYLNSDRSVPHTVTNRTPAENGLGSSFTFGFEDGRIVFYFRNVTVGCIGAFERFNCLMKLPVGKPRYCSIKITFDGEFSLFPSSLLTFSIHVLTIFLLVAEMGS